MIYHFDRFSLDTDRFALFEGQTRLAVEPKVLSLLITLVENRHRLVTREELVSGVWHGRVISDAAVATAIRSLRRALGDSGAKQSLVRTVHGKGLQFIAEVTESFARASPRAAPSAAADEQAGDGDRLLHERRPSVAVLRFRAPGKLLIPLAEGLPHDLISSLCRLRWLFVIARGSSFRFVSHGQDVREVGTALNVRYCLSGAVTQAGGSLLVDAELADTRTGALVWQNRYEESRDDIHSIRRKLTDAVVATLDVEIPRYEAELAAVGIPASLDAWSHYHLGVRHMFRFQARDNAIAAEHFRSAISQAPEFARAYAGLSFTSFQDAFLKYTPDSAKARLQAHRFAEQGLALDPRDPFTNLCMGRAYWLESQPESSQDWLDRATRLSPNYAQAIYAHAMADALCGRAESGAVKSELAMALSPLDPLFYGMLGARSLSCLVVGDYESAATWADRATRSPGAHALIDMIALAAHTLKGDDHRARQVLQRFRQRRSDFRKEDFFRAFPFTDEKVRGIVAAALGRHGL